MSCLRALALFLSTIEKNVEISELTFVNFGFKLVDLKVKRGFLIHRFFFVRLEYFDNAGVLLEKLLSLGSLLIDPLVCLDLVLEKSPLKYH